MFDINNVFEPKTLDEALVYLNQHPDSIAICGGTDVLIKNREGKLRDLDYVCIRHLEELHGITIDENGTIFIGSASTFSEIQNNDIINEHCKFLADAVSQVGAVQIRNMGTVGGNLCNGVPSADSATSIVILEAKLHLQSVRGHRVVDIKDFYLGVGKTVVEHDELLTKIEIPKENYSGYKGVYIKYARRKAMDIATIGIALKVKLSLDKTKIEDVKMAYACVSPTPVRGFNQESNLNGMELDGKVLDVIDNFYLSDIKARDSWRASKEFREMIVNELTKRALAKACVNSGGKNVYDC